MIKSFSSEIPFIKKVKKNSILVLEFSNIYNFGKLAVQSLRLLLVTPLILTRFDEIEITVWYLFASIIFWDYSNAKDRHYIYYI